MWFVVSEVEGLLVFIEVLFVYRLKDVFNVLVGVVIDMGFRVCLGWECLWVNDKGYFVSVDIFIFVLE